MTIPTQAGDSRKQIFISYSHEPPENADFARWLAGNLRIAGFAPWLDEEQIPGGAEVNSAITRAIEESDVGLFLVSKRWEERPYTKHEVELFGERESARKVIVEREPTVLKKLGPYLGPLKRVSWFADDPVPDARFWEIYCAVEGIPLGPRDDWAEQGAKVLRKARITPPPLSETKPIRSPTQVDEPKPQVRVAAPRPPQTRVALPCKGKPLASLAGEDWNFLVTDRQEWLGMRADGELHEPFAGLAEHAAATIGAAGRLLVGLYSSQVGRLRDGDWEYLAQEAPVLSLCACPDADLAGTAAGTVVLLERGSKSSTLFRMRDPVIGLASYDGGVVALGSRGVFGRIGWPPDKSGETLTWIDTDGLGRPAGFFTAVEQDFVGIYSPTRVGILQPATGQMVLCSYVFDEGIRDVVFFGAQRWPYGVLTDAGSLVLVDSAMYETSHVRLPAPVRGCSPGGWSGIASAWTSEGSVYRLTFDGPCPQIAEGDAILAYSPVGNERILHVVRWSVANGTDVEIRRF